MKKIRNCERVNYNIEGQENSELLVYEKRDGTFAYKLPCEISFTLIDDVKYATSLGLYGVDMPKHENSYIIYNVKENETDLIGQVEYLSCKHNMSKKYGKIPGTYELGRSYLVFKNLTYTQNAIDRLIKYLRVNEKFGLLKVNDQAVQDMIAFILIGNKVNVK